MRHFLGSLFAIAVAGVAAIAATSAFLDAPVHPSSVAAIPVNAAAPETPPATAAPPAGSTEATKPAADAPAGGTAAPVGKEPGKDASKEDEADADPYEGIAPEELPPDLQYSADSSVSFPTNI